VHEHILGAVIADDEAEALLAVEEFYDARGLADNLGGHPAATAAAAAETTAATAAAEAAASTAAIATATAATAEAIAAAAESATVTEVSAIVSTIAFVAETFALVSAAPAAIPTAPSIETHALFVFPVRPQSPIKPKRRTKNAGVRAPNSRAARIGHSPKSDTPRPKFDLITVLIRFGAPPLPRRHACTPPH
jgi:hypothetical protein